jgi:hypothetical protein
VAQRPKAKPEPDAKPKAEKPQREGFIVAIAVLFARFGMPTA